MNGSSELGSDKIVKKERGGNCIGKLGKGVGEKFRLR